MTHDNRIIGNLQEVVLGYGLVSPLVGYGWITQDEFDELFDSHSQEQYEIIRRMLAMFILLAMAEDF